MERLDVGSVTTEDIPQPNKNDLILSEIIRTPESWPEVLKT